MSDKHHTRLALTLSLEEATTLQKRLAKSTYLAIRGVEAFVEPSAEPFTLPTGDKVPGAYLKIRAATEATCFLGVGYALGTAGVN